MLERLRAPPGALAFCVVGEEIVFFLSLPLVAHYSERDTEGERERGRERRISQVICSCSSKPAKERGEKAGKDGDPPLLRPGKEHMRLT